MIVYRNYANDGHMMEAAVLGIDHYSKIALES